MGRVIVWHTRMDRPMGCAMGWLASYGTTHGISDGTCCVLWDDPCHVPWDDMLPMGRPKGRPLRRLRSIGRPICHPMGCPVRWVACYEIMYSTVPWDGILPT